ncbi:AsnC family transcriptional regulator [Kineococcus sp. T90]|nr:AsnC family transcriptional regulator [Kineococcus indalonis]
MDARILLALDEDPDATVLALARALGVARNTVSARMARMAAAGVLGEVSRRLDPGALGYRTVAFVSIALSQASSEPTVAALRTVPEVVEMHSTTGEADLLLKVVARDTDDLHRLTRSLLGVEGVVRTSTAISLAQELPTRYRELLVRVARGG